MQVASNANARAESEKPNESTLERKLRLTRNQGWRDLNRPAVMLRRGYQKIPFGIMGLHEVLGRDYGIKNPMGDPVRMTACFLRVSITNPLSLAI